MFILNAILVSMLTCSPSNDKPAAAKETITVSAAMDTAAIAYNDDAPPVIKVITDSVEVAALRNKIRAANAKIVKGKWDSPEAEWGRGVRLYGFRQKPRTGITSHPFDTIVNEFLAAGILHKRPKYNEIYFPKGTSEHDREEFIDELFCYSPTEVWFGGKIGDFPVQFTNLFKAFARNSGGVLKDMIVMSECNEKTCKYTISICYKQYGFVATFKDCSRYFNINAINGLLAKISAYSGSKKRFTRVITGDPTMRYIFGDPVKVKKVMRKYGFIPV